MDENLAAIHFSRWAGEAPKFMPLERIRRQVWIGCALAIAAFAGWTATARRLAHTQEVRADSDRVFELRVYHCLPDKLPKLEARFRDATSKILARHNLNVVGYWVADGPSTADNTFIWIVAYPSMEDGKSDWAAMSADPEFQQLIKAEQAEKLVQKVDVTYLRPTDFSAIR